MCDLSIIIPVFNNSRSIKHCLQSIFDNKTKYEYEVILVCDPSTDNTNKIIDEFAKKYNNIFIYNVSDRHIAKARDKGIKSAQGKYLMFIDADDCYTNDAIETMINLIKNNDADIGVGNYYYLRTNKKEKNIFATKKTYNNKQMVKALLNDTFMHGFMWNKIYKKELFKEDIFIANKNIIREDVLTNIQIFMRANKLVSTTKPMYIYDKRYESATSKTNPTRVPTLLNIYALEKYIIQQEKPELLKIFNSRKLHRKLLLLGDLLIVKDGYEKEEYKEFKSFAFKQLKQIEKENPIKPTDKAYSKLISEYASK